MLRPQYTIGQSSVQLSARQPVRWSKMAVRRPIRPHDHEFTEICLVLEGRALHVTGQGAVPIRKNHVLVVPPGEVHAFSRIECLEVLNIYYLTEWFLPELRLEVQNDGILPVFFADALFAQKGAAQVRHFEQAPSALRDVQEELRGLAELRSHRWTVCCFFKALLLLANAAWRQERAGPPEQVSATVWRAMAEIDRLIAAGEKLDLAKLARALGMTRDHLGKRFRKEAGETPKSFHQRWRLQFVRRLLLGEALNLAEIAQRMGYADEAHLCRSFRREFGLTPRAYRLKFCDAISSTQNAGRAD